jgi:hypothetical protein
MRRRCIVGFLGAFLAAAIPAGASAADKRVGVPKFDGAKEALVRKKVMQVLRAHGFDLVKSREMAAGAHRASARIDSDDGLAAIAKELALSAIVTGDVGAKRAKLTVHNGADGSVLGDATFTGANPRKLAMTVGRDFWRHLGSDIGRGHVPAGAKKPQNTASEEAPEDKEEEAGAGEHNSAGETGGNAEEKREPGSEPARGGKTAATAANEPASWPPTPYPWFEATVGGGGLFRSLSWHEDVSATRLLPYSISPGPVAVVTGAFYPLQLWVGPGALAGLGVEAEVIQGFAISSTENHPTTGAPASTYSNTVHDYAGGLRYRIGFSGEDQAIVSATFGEDAFTFSGATRPSLQIPDTIYHYIRGGAQVRLALPAKLSVAVGAGYRQILNKAGTQLSEHFFPHLTVAGADANVDVGYPLTANLGVQVGVLWRRYWYSMHSIGSDNYIAGGAVDQSFTVTAALTVVFGATRSGAAAALEEAPPPAPKAREKAKNGGSDEAGGGDSSGGDESNGGGEKSGGGSGGDL